MSANEFTVEYRMIQGFPGYRIGNDGSVWSQHACGSTSLKPKWRRLKPILNGNGYHQVTLSNKGMQSIRGIHTLVLMSFVSSPPTGMGARHLDGNPTNNALGNLAWGTQLENMRDKYRHGTMLYKLSHDDVVQLRQDYDNTDIPVKQLALKYNIARATVTSIATGRQRPEVLGIRPPRKAARGHMARGGKRRISPDDVFNIRQAIASGRSRAQVAIQHGLSVSTICDIAIGRTWQFVGGPITRMHYRKTCAKQDV